MSVFGLSLPCLFIYISFFRWLFRTSLWRSFCPPRFLFLEITAFINLSSAILTTCLAHRSWLLTNMVLTDTLKLYVELHHFQTLSCHVRSWITLLMCRSRTKVNFSYASEGISSVPRALPFFNYLQFLLVTERYPRQCFAWQFVYVFSVNLISWKWSIEEILKVLFPSEHNICFVRRTVPGLLKNGKVTEWRTGP